MSPVLIFILLSLIAYKIYQFYTSVPPNIPPCLPRLPYIGSYWHLLWRNYKAPVEAFEYYVNKLRSKIISCYLGKALTIVVTDYNTIKDVLSREEFDGRLTGVEILLERGFGKDLGIFFAEGKFLQEQRRFFLKNMRDFGFSRRLGKYEAHVMEEINILVKMLKEGPINDQEKECLKDGMARFPDILQLYTTNSIWDIMFGTRFDRSELHKVRQFCATVVKFQRVTHPLGGALFYYWYLKYFGNMFLYKDFMDTTRCLIAFVKEYIDKSRNSMTDAEDEDRGVVDRFLKEMKKDENGTSNFTEEQLIISTIDIVSASVGIVPSSMFSAIKLIMHYPEVLRKVQEEMDRVVGTGRLVTWDDRTSLPYVEATLREVFRYESLAPSTVFHKALKDGTINGYNVPKGTILLMALNAMHRDSDLWGDPEKFRPERFLDDNGELVKDLSLPFGFGRRMCISETYSRYHLFEVFAVLVQNFNFSFVEGEPTGLDDKLPGLTITPKETWIRVQPRFA